MHEILARTRRGLLDAKANVNYSNLFDQTPLFSCAVRTDLTLLAYLIKRGAKVNHWNKVCDYVRAHARQHVRTCARACGRSDGRAVQACYVRA